MRPSSSVRFLLPSLFSVTVLFLGAVVAEEDVAIAETDSCD